MFRKSHDLTVAILLVVVFAVLSLPTRFVASWTAAPWTWLAYFVVGGFLGVYVTFAFLQAARRLFAHAGAAPEAEHPGERSGRRLAIAVFGAMLLVWIVLSAVSFIGNPSRTDPATVRFQTASAIDGKRVFQAYNCMGCHTIVGNGAYFGPDLTKTYRDAGPAWLMAFLGSSGSWPPGAAVDGWVERLREQGVLDVRSSEDYYARYPGARVRVSERGGRATLMPNVVFADGEPGALVAFMDYAARVDTRGWPPPVKAEPAAVARARGDTGAARSVPSAPAVSSDAAAGGEQLLLAFGCVGCHSTDGTPRVGPTFKNLAGAAVPLADGSSVVADQAYLRESILDPQAKVVKGFPAGTMPPFRGRLSDEQLASMLAFIEKVK